jgi:hypothetical protein
MTTLDCVFCGKDYRTFNSLAFHVAHDCPKSPIASGRDHPVPAGVPRSGGRMSKETTKEKKTSNYDATEAENTFGNGFPLLTMDAIDPKGTIATLTGEITDYESEFGSGVFVGITIGRKQYDFRIRHDSGNFPRLKKIAPTQKQLRGKSVTLTLKAFKGHDYIAIV